MINKLLRKNYLLFFTFLLILPGLSNAQEKTDSSSFWQNKIISARFHYGVVMAHHAYIQHLVTGHTTGFEIDLLTQADGSKPWHNQYLLPQTGFIFIHLDLANPDILGNADGLLYAMNFPFSSKPRTIQPSLRLGCGLGWVSKTYERIENHKEIAIGSHLNAAIQINFETKINFSKRLSGNFNIGITHFSNGSITLPNLGINNGSASIGLNYALTSPATTKYNLPEVLSPVNKIHYDLIAAAGTHAVAVVGKNEFFIFTLSGVALKEVSVKRRLGIGMDIFYDPALIPLMIRDSVPLSGNLDKFRSGIYLDHEQVIGKTSILFQVGIYTIDPYKNDGMIYDRLGFKYQFTERYFANLTLKAHIAKANYLEWGVGMKI